MLKSQKGQAIPLGLALIMMVTLSGIVLFNTGQMTSEKSRMTNTADAAVYSGLIWQARALNFQSYTNRAMVANQVSIAQLVSIASWSTYQKITSENLDNYLGWIPYVGIVTEYYKQLADYADRIVQPLVAAAVPIIDSVTGVLSASQQVMFLSTYVATPSIVKYVVEENDKRYKVDSKYGVVSLALNAYDWNKLSSRYTNDDDADDGFDEMKRKGDIILASRDDFTRQRRYIEPGEGLPSIGLNSDWWELGNRRFNIVKDGETRLIYKPDASGAKWEWKGKDTVSLHSEKWKLFKWKKNRESIPIGWGSRYVEEEIECDDDGDCPRWAHSKKKQNKRAEKLADLEAEAIDGTYSGVRSYYDLQELIEGDKDPRLRLRVEVHTENDKVRTSTKVPNLGSESPPGGGRRRGVVEKGMFYAGDRLAGDSVSAIGSGEVYFKRPVYKDSGYSTLAYVTGHNNLIVNKRVRKEYASQFNPYWEVRLIELPKAQQAVAWLLNTPELATASVSGVVAGVKRYAAQQGEEIRILTNKAQRLQAEIDRAKSQQAKTALQSRLSGVQQRLTQLNTVTSRVNNTGSQLAGIVSTLKNPQTLPNYSGNGGAGSNALSTVTDVLNNGANSTQVANQTNSQFSALGSGMQNGSLQQYANSNNATLQNINTNAQTGINTAKNQALLDLQKLSSSIQQQIGNEVQDVQAQFDSEVQLLQQQIQQKQTALAATTDPIVSKQLKNTISTLNNKINKLNQGLQARFDQVTTPLQQQIDDINLQINNLQSVTQSLTANSP
jgi:predicted  nucleic acid-binding Zn-ribbon protein